MTGAESPQTSRADAHTLAQRAGGAAAAQRPTKRRARVGAMSRLKCPPSGVACSSCGACAQSAPGAQRRSEAIDGRVARSGRRRRAARDSQHLMGRGCPPPGPQDRVKGERRENRGREIGVRESGLCCGTGSHDSRRRNRGRGVAPRRTMWKARGLNPARRSPYAAQGAGRRGSAAGFEVVGSSRDVHEDPSAG